MDEVQRNGPYTGFDMQGPMRYSTSNPHHLGPSMLHHPTIHENFPLTIGTHHQEPEKPQSLAEYSTRLDRTKSTSDDEDPNFAEDPSKFGSKKDASPWHRVKWTDAMVRLLITAVSYISEEAAASEPPGSGAGSRRRCTANLQKKGKWKSVSKAMAERGHFVSPQQCEDKFNDLNKRYKRLNEILGRGTSCEVVENPVILDSMEHVPDKAKEEVRKILSSKHLHYEEMCSYHNGNRLHLPPDPDLQRSLRLALRNREEHHHHHHQQQQQQQQVNDGTEEEEDQGMESDESEKEDEPANPKRLKRCGARGDGLVFEKPPEGEKEVDVERWMRRKGMEVEQRRLEIEGEMLELERERFKWQRFCKKKDRELETTRMEIEVMRLENERLALELKHKEFGFNRSS